MRVLTQDQVVAAALALVDAGGTDALSMRAAAAELGVAPNALYTYFPTRAALVAALIEQVLAEVDGGPLGSDWRAGVRGIASALRAALARHPGMVPLMVAGPMFGPQALGLGERVLALLVDAGFPPDDAARVLYTVLAYVLGFAAMDAAELPDGPAPTMAERVATRLVAFEDVPAEHFPHTRATATTAAGYVTDEQFRYGLDALIAGIAPLCR